MAGETEGNPEVLCGSSGAPSITGLFTRHPVFEAGLALVLALLAFVLYWFLGPGDTSYPYQVSQANNLIHGHLDLRPEHTKNLGVLERVLYDGERFCLPPGDEGLLDQTVEYVDAINSGVPPERARASVISPSCRTYMQHSLGPAFVVLPGVLVWGKDLNQTLVSAVIGALTAPLVFAIARRLSDRVSAQLGLTVLMMFGTIFWWVAANGGVWFFAHTVAVFFLFGAIYFTIARPRPAAAGALLGAAFMARPTMLAAGLFFVVMFAPLWLRPDWEGRSLLKRINWEPVAQFASGIAPLILMAMVVNYLRFDNPLESGYNYSEQVHQTFLQGVYSHGILHPSYIERHPPVFLAAMPVFQQGAPYVLPSWFGMAMWATTPALFYAFFANIKRYWHLTLFGVVILALAASAMLSGAMAEAWDRGWASQDIPLGIHFLPFWVMIAVAIVAGIRSRDRLVIACWAAIVPTALSIFMFAATGWSQFGYRYGLDFLPFLWLLVVATVGDELRWHHWLLIGASVVVNLAGVLWIYQFEPHDSFGVTEWVVF